MNLSFIVSKMGEITTASLWSQRGDCAKLFTQCLYYYLQSHSTCDKNANKSLQCSRNYNGYRDQFFYVYALVG